MKKMTSYTQNFDSPLSQSTGPLVSIMMPAYNAEKYIEQAIESVLNQTYTNWELIIVNDGSKDGTEKVITRFHDQRIKAISQLNGGESAARNTALKAVKGEYLAFLDADDVFLPNHLELTLGYLSSHPDFDGVYTDGHYCNQEGDILQTLSSGRRGPFQGRIFQELVRASDVFGPPTCVVLRHHIIVENQLNFDTNIVIGPDWDFMTRYSEFSKFGYLDQHTCLYRVHQTNITLRASPTDRVLSLARCREKAIKLSSFDTCTIDVKVYVFYDLLINLLSDYPEHQMVVLQFREFQELPTPEQARLLRLMASKSLLNNEPSKYVQQWLDRSRVLNPKDQRGAFINAFYNLSPELCVSILRLKQLPRKKKIPHSLFGDLKY
jgi:glycosyltransferase involved in cell wall biosynthesis